MVHDVVATLINSQNATDITLDKANETATLTFADELQPGSTAVLHIVFKGVLNESMNGFYRSSFKDDAGKTHYIATTQFEATDARKAFPCWDEVQLNSLGLCFCIPLCHHF